MSLSLVPSRVCGGVADDDCVYMELPSETRGKSLGDMRITCGLLRPRPLPLLLPRLPPLSVAPHPIAIADLVAVTIPSSLY